MGNSSYKDDLNVYGLNIFLLTDYTIDADLFESCFGFSVPDDNIIIPQGSCIRYNHPLYKHFSITQFGNFNEKENNSSSYSMILQKIKDNVQSSLTENENNLVICFCKTENSALPKEILSQLNTLYTHYHPPVILVTAKPKYLEYMINTTLVPYDKKMLFYCSLDNKESLLNDIIKVFCYYSQYHEIDSYFPILNDKSMMNIFHIYNQEFFNTQMINESLSRKYAHTVNIMVVGRPGVGKSTLINIILGQRRCKESGGRCITNKLKLIKHKTLNISLYDTPGFEDKSGSEIIMNYIKKFKSDKYNINYNVHFILFLINSKSRTLLDGDEEFIKFCLDMNIPIRFVLTRCENILKAKDARNVLLNDLTKIDVSLSNSIICVQLKDETESNIVRFGYNELMEEICFGLSQAKSNNSNFFLKNINSIEMVYEEGARFAEKIINYLNKEGDTLIENEFVIKWIIKSIGAGFGIDIPVNEVNMMYHKWNMDKERTMESIKNMCKVEFMEKIKIMTFKKYIEKVKMEYNEGIATLKNLTCDNEFTLLG